MISVKLSRLLSARAILVSPEKQPPALGPSTMNNSDLAGSRSWQSASFPGRLNPSRRPFRLVSSRAFRAASRACAASTAFPMQISATFDRVDVVDEREDGLVVAVVILHRHLDERAVGFLHESDRIWVERVLGTIDPLDVLGNPTLKLEDVPAVVDLIHDDDAKACVEECELPQAGRQNIVVELDRFEDLRIRKERDDRARPLRRADDLEVRGLFPALEAHPVLLAFALHADLEPFAQAVDHRETDAVKSAGHAVHLPFELPPAVHPRQDDLDARRAVLRVDVDRDAPTIVRHGDGSVRVQGDLDLLAKAGHRLVDGVVDHLVDEVVEAARVDRADVHRRPLSDRLQAFEDLDLRGVVGGLFYHLFRNLLERVSVPSRSPFRRTAQVYDRHL